MVSAEQAAEDVFQAGAEGEDSLHVSWSAGAEGAGDFHGCAGFTAFGQGDGVSPSLIGVGLTGGTFRGIERGADGALPGLLPQLRIADANTGDQLHQLQGELVTDELMMGEREGVR